MKDTYNDGYKTEDIKCIIVDFIAEDGKGGYPIMRQGTYVLCKDCIWWCECKTKDKYPFKKDSCSKFGTKMDADDFCSRGKREDD